MSYPFPAPHIYTAAEAKASDLHGNTWSVFTRLADGVDRYTHHSLVNDRTTLDTLIARYRGNLKNLLIVEAPEIVAYKADRPITKTASGRWTFPGAPYDYGTRTRARDILEQKAHIARVQAQLNSKGTL